MPENSGLEVKELYRILSEPHAFTKGEIEALAGPDDEFFDKGNIADSSRVIFIASPYPDENRYILDKELFKWYCRLNFRLAICRQSSLKESQVVSLLSQLRNTGRWQIAPVELIEWGKKYGLICDSHNKNAYNFPLSRIVYAVKKNKTIDVFDILLELFDKNIDNICFDKLAFDFINEGFEHFNTRVSEIVKQREGLRGNRKRSLQELGDSHHLTRERIRQIEEEFWISLFYKNRRLPFIKSFFCYFMSSTGSLIINENKEAQLFLAKMLGIPVMEARKLKLIILGLTPKESNSFKKEKWRGLWISSEEILGYLSDVHNIPISRADLASVAANILEYTAVRLEVQQNKLVRISGF